MPEKKGEDKMILTDKDIRCLSLGDKKKNLSGGMITPFDEISLQSESYDLSIGCMITTMKKEVRCIDVTAQEDLDFMYDKKELPLTGYVLSPKEYVIVSIKESIKMPENITAHIRPRTRFTRMGLIVSDQHCNSSYEGNLKLGLFNATDFAIKIFPGVKIAQIVFEELKEKPSEEKLYLNKKDAAYHKEESFIGAMVDEEFDKKVTEAVSFLLEKGK
ncbi:MAG: dCTP deaminase [Faecalimonas sp.]|nr:dCTP deaminase [Faecalimonas sp.]